MYLEEAKGKLTPKLSTNDNHYLFHEQLTICNVEINHILYYPLFIYINKSLGITYCLYHHAWWYAFITVWLRQMWAIKQKILCRKLQY